MERVCIWIEQTEAVRGFTKEREERGKTQSLSYFKCKVFWNIKEKLFFQQTTHQTQQLIIFIQCMEWRSQSCRFWMHWRKPRCKILIGFWQFNFCVYFYCFIPLRRIIGSWLGTPDNTLVGSIFLIMNSYKINYLK